ncbi:hypothetical protein AV521_45830 [Streptomyces sp. IMTB 2501]|uniref:DUF2235 domain-containing protein n=1 Tax=Streptomyces sp. IMTB 2501 TaxID=1776340 RepID=UPI00096F7EFE|nr:DUF2235 domain-containing protein [Streptomyces sp. IMTB 2501]OLZ59230.1 hypothetical protein AV521_45830 [Streptomyces sp. IMTB 2501]
MVKKRLVVCCDGTWDKADQSCRTNVSKVALAIRPRDSEGMEQRVYYHRGVGTHWWDKWRGGAFGLGLSQNVVDAYRFLVDNYEPSDELYLFGFSRGAFTARSVAGLVRNCGVLRREDAGRLTEAWDLYRDRVEGPNGVASTLFRRAYAHEPRIRFIGVWDTVGSLGIPWLGGRGMNPLLHLLNRRSQFHDPKLSSRVDGAFQALAIDEERPPYKPTLWEQQPWAHDQELKQVWFSGSHGDIGGGYPDTSLSDLALLWMIRQAERYELEFDPSVLSNAGPERMTPAESVDFRVHPNPLGDLHNSRTGLYVLLPAYHRPIDHHDPHGFEALADSAKLRYDLDSRYDPNQLAAYLRDPGKVHIEPVPGVRPDTM